MLPLKTRRAVKDAHPHPAKFSETVLQCIEELANKHGMVGPTLDPFAGVGKVFELAADTRLEPILAVEIEREWADDAMNRKAMLGVLGKVVAADFFSHARLLDVKANVIITSCTYGNRMADHHEARDASKRNTYRHKLGRQLTDGNSGAMQWGDDYQTFHVNAWLACKKLLAPGGWFVLNVSDHIRKGHVEHVVGWHRAFLVNVLHMQLVEDVLVSTPRNGFGANGDVRVDGEHVLVFRKPAA